MEVARVEGLRFKSGTGCFGIHCKKKNRAALLYERKKPKSHNSSTLIIEAEKSNVMHRMENGQA